jgi:putative transcriptional regulator
MKNKKLEELTGLSQAWVSRLKMAEAMPDRLTSETLEKLCEALECEPGDLLKIS